jgi:hypothetical protein
MRIINVIVTCNSDGLSTIDSFGIADEQDSQTVIDQAEERFIEQVVHNSDIEDVESEKADILREDAAIFIDDGCYEFHDEDETCVFLTWSSIENVQL